MEIERKNHTGSRLTEATHHSEAIHIELHMAIR